MGRAAAMAVGASPHHRHPGGCHGPNRAVKKIPPGRALLGTRRLGAQHSAVAVRATGGQDGVADCSDILRRMHVAFLATRRGSRFAVQEFALIATEAGSLERREHLSSSNARAFILSLCKRGPGTL